MCLIISLEIPLCGSLMLLIAMSLIETCKVCFEKRNCKIPCIILFFFPPATILFYSWCKKVFCVQKKKFLQDAAKVVGEFGSDLSRDQFLCILHTNRILRGKSYWFILDVCWSSPIFVTMRWLGRVQALKSCYKDLKCRYWITSINHMIEVESIHLDR